MRRTHKIFPVIDKLEIDGNSIALSCWVRVEIYGKWYEVYHRNVYPTEDDFKSVVSFIQDCFKSMHLYSVGSKEELDQRMALDQVRIAHLNIEEKERVLVRAYIDTNQTHKI